MYFKKKFTQLPIDVIFSVFGCSDIASVVAAGQTCKELNALAFSRPVWLDLVTDLKWRGFLDEGSTPDLRGLSAEQLVGVVKRIVNGPATWDPALAVPDPDDPEQAASIVPCAQRAVPAKVKDLDYSNDARLVPGGRHVLFKNTDRLECWSLAERRLVWASPRRKTEYVDDFEFEVVEGGEALHILLVRGGMSRESPAIVEVHHLDLKTGQPTQLLLYTGLPSHGSAEAVCGDLCVIEYGDDHLLLILDWRAHTALVLKPECHSGQHYRVSVIPGHLVLLHSASGGDELRVYSTAALRTHLAPLPSAIAEAPCILLSALPTELTHALEGTAFPPWKGRGRNKQDPGFAPQHMMAVLASPLAPGAYRVWVNVLKTRLTSTNVPAIAALHSFALHAPALGRAGEVRLRARGVAPASPLHPVYRRPAFSGHAQRPGRGGYVWHASDDWVTYRAQVLDPVRCGEDYAVWVELKKAGPSCVHVAEYAGAWTYIGKDGIVVLSFA